MLTISLITALILIISFLHTVKKYGGDFQLYSDLKPIIRKFHKTISWLFIIAIVPILLIVYFGLGFDNLQHRHLSFTGIQFEDTLKVKNTAGRPQSFTQNTFYDLFFIKHKDSVKVYYNLHDNICSELLFARRDDDVQWINKAYDRSIENRLTIEYDSVPKLEFNFEAGAISRLLVNGHNLPVKEKSLELTNDLWDITERYLNSHPDLFGQGLKNKLFAVLNGCKIVKSGGEKGMHLDFFPGAFIQKTDNVAVSIDGIRSDRRLQFYYNNFIIPNGVNIETADLNTGVKNIFVLIVGDRSVFYEFKRPVRLSLFNKFDSEDTCRSLITTNENTVFTNISNDIYYTPEELVDSNIYNFEVAFNYRKGRGNEGFDFVLNPKSPSDSLDKSKDKFLFAVNSSSKVKWQMQIVNTAPKFMYLWICIPMLLLYLLIFLSHNYFYDQKGDTELKWYHRLPVCIKQREYQYKNYNPVISAILMVFIPLLAFRIFLMWRANSFPPLSGGNLAKFSHYFEFSMQSLSIVSVFFAVLAGISLWVILFLAKPGPSSFGIRAFRTYNLLMDLKWVKWVKSREIVKKKNSKLILYLVTGGLLLLINCYYWGKAAILDQPIQRNFAMRLATTSFLIFFMYTFFEVRKYYSGFYGEFKKQKNSGLINFVIWLFFITVLLLELKLEKSFLVVTVISIIIWALLTAGKLTGKKPKFHQTLGFKSLVGFLIICIVAFSPYITRSSVGFAALEKIDSKKQTVARLALMTTERDSLLLNYQSVLNSESFFNKVIATNQTQAFINWYQKRGGFFTLFPELKEHYDISGRFGDQATDLTALRYIAAEHGWLILVPIVLLLFIPLYSRLIVDKYPKNYEIDKHSRFVNADLFYLIIFSMLVVFVTLSSTNMFIFMGLDLPIIGFHSMQAIVLPLILLFIIALSYNNHFEDFKVSTTEDQKLYRGSFTAIRKAYIWTFMLSLFALIIYMNLFQYKNKRANNKYSLEEFNNVMSAETEVINRELQEFQIRCLNRDKSLSESAMARLIFDSVYTVADAGKNRNQKFLGGQIRSTLKGGKNWMNSRNDFLRPEIISLEEGFEVFRFSYLNPHQKRFPIDDEYKKQTVIYLQSEKNRTIVLSRTIIENGVSKEVYPKRDSFPLIYHLAGYFNKEGSKKDSIKLSLNLDINDRLSEILKTNSQFTGRTIEYYRKYHDFNLLRSDELKNIYNGTGIWWDDITHRLKTNIGEKDTLLTDIQTKALEKISQSGSNGKLAAKLKEFIEDEIAENCKKINITAVDQNGAIAVLFSFNTDFSFDPNKMRDLDLQFDEYKKVATNEGALANSLLKHPCMQKMYPGPGSAMKPIMYSAITSESNFPWANLVVSNNFHKFIKESKYGWVQENYGEENILDKNIYWHTPGKEGVFGELDPGNSEQIGPVTYLSKSSNLYHSVVLFLGYYPTTVLPSYGNLFKRGARENLNFPVLQVNNSKYYFDSLNWPVGNFISSPVYIGLKNNFGFKFTGLPDTTNGFANDLAQNAYVFGERPVFDTSYLYLDNNKFSWLKKYVVTAVSGGDPISISPLQMGYLSAVLFSQNRNLRLNWTATDSANKNYTAFEKVNNRYDAVFKSAMVSLGKDIFNSGGTLSNLRNSLFPEVKNLSQVAKIGPLFLFAKTGTSNIARSKKPSDKLLIGCLSEKDISTFSNQDQFKNNRLIAFFIQHNEGRDKQPDGLRSIVIQQLTKLF